MDVKLRNFGAGTCHKLLQMLARLSLTLASENYGVCACMRGVAPSARHWSGVKFLQDHGTPYRRSRDRDALLVVNTIILP